MDSIILMCVILFWLFVAIGLRNLYIYFQNKKHVVYRIEQTIFYKADTKQKNDSTLIKTIKRITKYSDDFSSIGQRVNFFSEPHEVEDWLRKAGNPLDLTVERFQGIKMFFTFAGFFLGVTFLVLGFPLSQFGIVFLPVIGYFVPILLIKNRAKIRQDQLRYDLPDFLDTISVSLKAGVSLDQALREVIKYFTGPLHEEFSRFNQEIDLGVQREAAYRNLLYRNDNEEFQSLIKSLIQGNKLGVPTATTFKLQANDMRVIRKEQVKEKAAKASPKVTLITTFIVMPTAIFLIGGLMIMNMFLGENSVLDMF